MQSYLIEFEYENYCQGYEWATATVLVRADSYTDGCRKIEKTGKYYNCQNFKNLTIE